MAEFTRVNGDFKPVINMDRAGRDTGEVNAVNAAISAATVQIQGPKLDFFTATANGGLSTTQIAAAIQTVQQLGTVYLYEYTDASNDTLALAVYPTGAWTIASLKAALEANAGWANAVTVTATATFTNQV